MGTYRREKRSPARKQTINWTFFVEGKNTEAIYLKRLEKHINTWLESKKVQKQFCFKIEGGGTSTKRLVDYAESKMRVTPSKSACIFLVFDKDNFTDFDKAIGIAEHKRYIPLWSNPCFELWLMLHHELIESALSTKDLHTKVCDQHGVKNTKTPKSIADICECIFSDPKCIHTAYKNAKKLDQATNPTMPTKKSMQNPNTQLVILFDKICEEIGTEWLGGNKK